MELLVSKHTSPPTPPKKEKIATLDKGTIFSKLVKEERNSHFLTAHCQTYEQFQWLTETWENMGTAEM